MFCLQTIPSVTVLEKVQEWEHFIEREPLETGEVWKSRCRGFWLKIATSFKKNQGLHWLRLQCTLTQLAKRCRVNQIWAQSQNRRVQRWHPSSITIHEIKPFQHKISRSNPIFSNSSSSFALIFFAAVMCSHFKLVKTKFQSNNNKKKHKSLTKLRSKCPNTNFQIPASIYAPIEYNHDR